MTNEKDIKNRYEDLSPKQKEAFKRKIKSECLPFPFHDGEGSNNALDFPSEVHGEPVCEACRQVDFSLFFFSGKAESKPDTNQYKFLLKCARFADEGGFEALWVPERHFNEFGGLYPNPAILAAVIGNSTKKIQIRAGSVVLPLHNVIRVAEEWAVADNISNGRIGISFAPGWHSDDFILSSLSRFEGRKKRMFSDIEVLDKLWKGQVVDFPDDQGGFRSLEIFPKPLRRELPIWISTSSKSKESWLEAGRRGYSILTALLEQSIDDLKENIKAYREALAANGHSANKCTVTLMLHAYVAENEAAAKAAVEKPMNEYLTNHFKMYEKILNKKEHRFDPGSLTEADRNALLARGFERYYKNSALIGSYERCKETVRNLASFGVNEIACLVDFGVEDESNLRSLQLLSRLKEDLRNVQ